MYREITTLDKVKIGEYYKIVPEIDIGIMKILFKSENRVVFIGYGDYYIENPCRGLDAYSSKSTLENVKVMKISKLERILLFNRNKTIIPKTKLEVELDSKHKNIDLFKNKVIKALKKGGYKCLVENYKKEADVSDGDNFWKLTMNYVYIV